ncbi:hypothetical protein [Desulfurispira natronophila]|uniref:Uncharacterized protein n=1 Tax=Desulfurispira natronophila TaxID=682562 RepID=A0A7W7Y3M6_9BACT|nr:hypothetical protein [Desulfurispira natronophila]MBB5021424.1 hypothetical protein [Desulfurispira natronophila]
MIARVDPTRIAVALSLVGSSLIAGVALILSDQLSFVFKVASVSMILLALLGYLAGVMIKEVHEEYLNFKGALRQKHALKVPITKKIPLNQQYDTAETNKDDDLDFHIDYAKEAQKDNPAPGHNEPNEISDETSKS